MNLRFFAVVFLLLLCNGVVVDADFFSELYHPRTQYVPYPADPYLVSMDIGLLSKEDGTVVAWGDFNNDKFTDAFVISHVDATSSELFIYVFDPATFLFKGRRNLMIDTKPLGRIESIIPADFNYDGRLDLLVVGRKSSTTFQMHVLLQNADATGFETHPVVSSEELISASVAVIDVNFDLRPDIIAITTKPSMAVFLNKQPHATDDNPGPFAFPPFEGPTYGDSPSLAEGYSLLYGDIDGDCAADVLLPTHTARPDCAAPAVCYVALIRTDGLLVTPSIDAKSPLVIALPAGAREATLSDVNSDGALDLVFVQCDASNPTCATTGEAASLVVYFNTAPPKTATADDMCQKHDVTLAPGTKGHLASYTALKGVVPTKMPTNDPVPTLSGVRMGDYDRDGYPDALVVLLNAKQQRQAVLLHNVVCGSSCKTIGTAAPGAALARRFDAMTGPSVAALTDGTDSLDVVTATFADFGDKGSYDVLLNLVNTQTGEGVVRTLFNNLPRQHYFVRLVPGNGVCRAWCAAPSATFVKPEPVGVSLSGSTWRMGHAAHNGDRVLRTASPLVRTSYTALDPPYEIVGLADADNQIDNLIFALPFFQPPKTSDDKQTVLQSARRLFIEGVFPRATVIAWPYEPSDATSWYGKTHGASNAPYPGRLLEQRLRYGGATFWSLVTVTGVVVLLAAVIGFFVNKERLQDEKDRKESAQVFSFSAF